jgi:hypothetical protein
MVLEITIIALPWAHPPGKLEDTSPYLNGGWCQGLRLGELAWGWLRGRSALSGSVGTGCGGRDVMVNRSSRGSDCSRSVFVRVATCGGFRGS